MLDTQQGLTKTYNAPKDPDCDDPAVFALRALPIELDRAVLHANGWGDIEVPSYTPPAPRPSASPTRPLRTPSSTASSPSTPSAPPKKNARAPATKVLANPPRPPPTPRQKKDSKTACKSTTQLPLGSDDNNP